MSKMEKFGMIVVLNCAFLMMVGTMMSMAPKGMTTAEFFNTSGTFLTTLFLIWNALVIHLVSLSTVSEG